MLRRIVRAGVRAVAGGGDPWGTHSREGKIIRTFTQDAVLRIPPAPCPEADRELLQATGRSVIGAHPKQNTAGRARLTAATSGVPLFV